MLVTILIAGGLVRAQDGASLAAGSATILGDNSQPVEPNPSAASSPEAGFGNAPQGGGLLRDQFAPTLQNAGGLDSAAASLASSDLARKLGLSPDQLAGLKNRLAGGQLSPDDVQQLCLRFAARQLAPSDVQAIAGSLGINLTDQQLAQLQSCTTIGGASTPQLNEAGSGAAGPSRTAAMPPPELSSIERSFHTLDSGAPPAAPSAANLSQFGYALFDSRVSTFAPVNDVPSDAIT